MEKLPTRTIHKLKLAYGHSRIQLPSEDVKAMSVGVSQGQPCLWYDRPFEPEVLFTDVKVNAAPESFKVTYVEILCGFTGEEYRLETDGWRFLGTIVYKPYQHSDDIVIHVYVKGF